MEECPTCGDEFDSAVSVKAHHQHHDRPYWDVVIENEYGEHPADVVSNLHMGQGLSFEDTAEEIGCSVQAVQRIAEDYDLKLRGRSEAMEQRWASLEGEDRDGLVKAAHEKTRKLVERGEHNFSNWAENATEAERRERTKAAREAHKEKYGDGGYLEKWVCENPERHQEVAERYASLGADAREKNGMAGVTGQDHHAWRGGKSIYDAVKKQLPENWRRKKVEAKKQDGHYCQNCGAIGTKLDSHHIVPIMAGGTNGFWNLITLCESCHGKAERFMRQYPEFDPVLVE